MSSGITKAIQDIVDKHPLATKIVNRSFSGFLSLSAEDGEDKEELDVLVKRLLETIEYQSKVIDQLSQRFPLPYDPEGIRNFKQANIATPVPVLCSLYTEPVLRQYEKDTRFLIATALVELAQDSNKIPSPVWKKLIANNGEFGD